MHELSRETHRNEAEGREQAFLRTNAEAMKRLLERWGWRTGSSFEETHQANDRAFPIVVHPIERDDASGLYSAFEQFDGSVIRVHRKEYEGIVILHDIVLTDYSESRAVSLREQLPANYMVIEGMKQGQGFVFRSTEQRPGIIALPTDFLATTTGRLIAAHEIGHARDFTAKPVSESERQALNNQEPSTTISRERSAWKEAKKFLNILREQGIAWLPPTFTQKDWDSFVAVPMDSYRRLRG